MLIMITSVSVTQFCAGSFSEYTAMTDIDIIFSSQIKHLKFFRFFFKFHIFEYALFGIIILSTVYLLFRPSDTKSVKSLVEKKSNKKDRLLDYAQ